MKKVRETALGRRKPDKAIARIAVLLLLKKQKSPGREISSREGKTV